MSNVTRGPRRAFVPRAWPRHGTFRLSRCRAHPDAPLAWTRLARVLLASDRYRDAVGPAREALAKGYDAAAGGVLLARLLSRLGPDAREESAALAVTALAGHAKGNPLGTHDLAEAVRIAHDGGADLEICRRGDDQVWAANAPEWLARLTAVAANEPAELARSVVERIEALQYFRLLIARPLFGAVEGLNAEAATFARARALLVDRHGRSIEEADLAATAPAAVSLGFGEPVPDPDAGLARHWHEHHGAIAAGLGMELAVRLRGSELAQAAFFAADGAGERGRVVLLHTLEHERGDWIRWAGANDRLHVSRRASGAGSRRAPLRVLSPCSRSRAGVTTTRSGRPSGPRAGTRLIERTLSPGQSRPARGPRASPVDKAKETCRDAAGAKAKAPPRPTSHSKRRAENDAQPRSDGSGRALRITGKRRPPPWQRLGYRGPVAPELR